MPPAFSFFPGGSGEKAATEDDIDDTPSLEAFSAKQKANMQKNSDAPTCTQCATAFSTTIRRHHCRKCGFVFCQPCSSSSFPLEAFDMRPVRVCDSCAWTEFREQTAVHSPRLLGTACLLCCWSKCCPLCVAQRCISKRRLASRLRKVAAKFGPLWSHLRFKFLLPRKTQGS